MNSILVICEGNICRSPMAQGLLAHALPNIAVHSAGLTAMVGYPADDIAVRLMSERGIDISAHRAMDINREMCLHSDIILVMDTEQRQRLEERYPQACGRIFRLGEFGKFDVPDPYRQPEQAFRQAFALIETSTREWLQRIHKLSRLHT
jgi:protein-tyrosine phosphatase